MKFRVLHALWGTDDSVFAGNIDHEVEKPSKQLLRAVGAAQAAGALVVLEVEKDERAVMDAHIEPDEKSAAKLAKAQDDGSWAKGNLEAFVADRSDRLAYDDTLADGVEEKLPAGLRAQYARELDEAVVSLVALEAGDPSS